VDGDCQHISADVELPSVVEQQILYVGLNDELLVLIETGLYLTQRGRHDNALSPVGVLSRLQNPDHILLFHLDEHFLELGEGLGAVLLQVVGGRHYFGYIFFGELVVGGDVVVKGVFIAKHEVVLVVIVQHFRRADPLQVDRRFLQTEARAVSLVLFLVEDLGQRRILDLGRLGVDCGARFLAGRPHEAGRLPLLLLLEGHIVGIPAVAVGLHPLHDLGQFELRPDEVGLGQAGRLAPPAALPEDRPDEVAVVAAAHEVVEAVVDDSAPRPALPILLLGLGLEVAVVGVEDDVEAVEHPVQLEGVVVVELFPHLLPANVPAGV
jgi:hypothetical protein